MLKRYALFTGSDFYPSGGWNDYKGTFDDELELYRYIATLSFAWFQIVDLDEQKIIHSGSRG